MSGTLGWLLLLLRSGVAAAAGLDEVAVVNEVMVVTAEGEEREEEELAPWLLSSSGVIAAKLVVLLVEVGGMGEAVVETLSRGARGGCVLGVLLVLLQPVSGLLGTSPATRDDKRLRLEKSSEVGVGAAVAGAEEDFT